MSFCLIFRSVIRLYGHLSSVNRDSNTIIPSQSHVWNEQECIAPKNHLNIIPETHRHTLTIHNAHSDTKTTTTSTSRTKPVVHKSWFPRSFGFSRSLLFDLSSPPAHTHINTHSTRYTHNPSLCRYSATSC